MLRQTARASGAERSADTFRETICDGTLSETKTWTSPASVCRVQRVVTAPFRYATVSRTVLSEIARRSRVLTSSRSNRHARIGEAPFVQDSGSASGR